MFGHINQSLVTMTKVESYYSKFGHGKQKFGRLNQSLVILTKFGHVNQNLVMQLGFSRVQATL